jgi:peptidoglycan/LPS O-acetylase OafA/YrhL
MHPAYDMNKITFANQLRGIAALSVVITHYFAVFFGMQDVLAAVTFSPNMHFVPPPWTDYLYFPHFNFGPFGVAVFFLISGFVIPFSIEKLSPRRFLLARAFRIYPTYLVCFSISCLAVWLSAQLYGTPYFLSQKALLANALLLHTDIGIASLDLVNWTLAVEIKFYLLMACFGAAVFRQGFGRLLAYALLVLCGTLLLKLAPPSFLFHGLRAAFVELNFVVFMTIGILFYQHLKGTLSGLGLLSRTLLLATLFVAGWTLGPDRGTALGNAHNYLFGLILFAAGYAARDWFRATRVLDFFADISYPLYLVHSLAGYVSMKWMMQQGLGFGAALPMTFATACLLAWLIHHAVELPSARLGKRLGRGSSIAPAERPA